MSSIPNIRVGSVVTILGPAGSGKNTLLQAIISRSEQPYENILVFGYGDIASRSARYTYKNSLEKTMTSTLYAGQPFKICTLAERSSSSPPIMMVFHNQNVRGDSAVQLFANCRHWNVTVVLLLSTSSGTDVLSSQHGVLQDVLITFDRTRLGLFDMGVFDSPPPQHDLKHREALMYDRGAWRTGNLSWSIVKAVVAPVSAPVVAPVSAPVVAPVSAPVVAPVPAPVVAPVLAPVEPAVVHGSTFRELLEKCEELNVKMPAVASSTVEERYLRSKAYSYELMVGGLGLFAGRIDALNKRVDALTQAFSKIGVAAASAVVLE